MLQSCIICKKRKKRCDFNLPSCTHCENMGAHCEYYDEGLGNNVPREYLKSLDDNIKNLKNEIEKYKKKIDQRTVKNCGNSALKANLYETIKNGTFVEGSDSVLHYFGPCSLVSVAYMASNILDLDASELEKLATLDYKTVSQIKIPFDYSLITSDHSRILISNYLTNIYPVFPLLSESFFHFDLMIKNYPDSKQLFILLILLVSSAHIMRKRADFITIKIMLQQKVLDLMKAKMVQADGDTLLSLILYSLYEMFDPEVGKSVWKTLSLAADIAERLQLKNLDNDIPLPGVVSKTILRSKFLQVLVFLDTEASIAMGKSPYITLSKNQILTLDDKELQVYFLDILKKVEFFNCMFSNSSDCDILRIFNISRSSSTSARHIWLISTPLLSHKCSKCDIYFDLMVVEILSASIQTLEHYDSVLKPGGIVLYWVAVTNISLAIINLIIIIKFHQTSYYGMKKDQDLFQYIEIGRRFLTQISSQWYYSHYIKSFVELALSKL